MTKSMDLTEIALPKRSSCVFFAGRPKSMRFDERSNVRALKTDGSTDFDKGQKALAHP